MFRNRLTNWVIFMSALTGVTAITTPVFAQIEPPTPEKRPVTIEQHGDERIDNYQWMKDPNWQEVLRDPSVLDPDIRAALEAENAYYEAMTGDLADLRERLFQEMRARIKEDDSSIPSPDGPFAYFTRFREGGDYPIFARTPREGGDETVLFDGDAERGESEFFSIGRVRHSPDHLKIAVATDRLGSENYAIEVRDIETGAVLDSAVKMSSGYAVWAADSQSFFYVERDENARPKRVKHHVVGQEAAQDRVVYEEADDGFFVGVGKSQNGEFIFVSSGNQVSSETWFLPANEPTSEPKLIAPRREDETYEVEYRDGYFYILTNADDAVDYKIVRTPSASPGRENWSDWLAHEAGTYISSFAATEDFLVRLERRDALPRIVISDYEGNGHVIEFDEAAYSLGLSTGYEFATDTIRFTYESPSQPEQTYDYNMRSRERTLLKTQEVPSGHNPDLYVVERINAPAEDGAQVPVTILRLKSTPKDGSAPLLLYGYGSYGATIPASFSTTRLSLVDRGVVYAIAHVRGGAARGRQWYYDGKLDKKQNTFSDFAAAADALIAGGWTSQGRIVIDGRSAGGLLVGATVNLRPELFGGVVAGVPFVDVLNTISDESLPLTPPEWPEWGDPIRTQEGYDWIKAYSPYENIKADETYPPILATGGLTDYRVTYWEPQKWIARLRDEAKGGPFILKMNMEAGHGGSAARFERLRETTDLYAFALKIFDLQDVEPINHAESD